MKLSKIKDSKGIPFIRPLTDAVLATAWDWPQIDLW